MLIYKIQMKYILYIYILTYIYIYMLIYKIQMKYILYIYILTYI